MTKAIISLMLVLSMFMATARAEEAGDAGHAFIPSTLTDGATLALLADLVVQGGVGYRQTERAAFLVMDPEGVHRLVLWPASNRFREERFRGTIPSFTIAIVHTHPANSRRPSYTDRETAMRHGIPVLVLTPRDIFAATPEGTTIALLENRLWVTRSSAGDGR